MLNFCAIYSETDSSVANKIISSVRQTLRSSHFMFEDNYARIISGEEEGISSWVTVNYLNDALVNSKVFDDIACTCLFTLLQSKAHFFFDFSILRIVDDLRSGANSHKRIVLGFYTPQSDQKTQKSASFLQFTHRLINYPQTKLHASCSPTVYKTDTVDTGPKYPHKRGVHFVRSKTY